MKSHKGMRPQDILVLLKIISKGPVPWLNKDLANDLKMSSSEITESLNRSKIAGLLDSEKRKVFKKAFYDFLIYGLKYVFPVQPGSLVRGVPTAHSAGILSKHFNSEEKYVWPFAAGKERGQAVEPLYPTVPEAVMNDSKLYDLLALTDVIRVGRAREIKLALGLLDKLMKD